jgi:hypothetical protein
MPDEFRAPPDPDQEPTWPRRIQQAFLHTLKRDAGAVTTSAMTDEPHSLPGPSDPDIEPPWRGQRGE